MPLHWEFAPPPNKRKVAALAEKLPIAPLMLQLLVQRGLESKEAVLSYCNPDLNMLHDPFLMKGMRQAVARIREAIANQEQIRIYGDYDVDGTTSVALLLQALREIGAKVDSYIPDRYQEGYGLSSTGAARAVADQVKVLLCIDCGTRSVDHITKLRAAGIDVIVADHHEPGPELPPTLALLNPKQTDCPYPFKELSGCGIGFKLLQALSKEGLLSTDLLHSYLDLVAVSIAADIVPMEGENRTLAYHGLRKLDNAPSIGLATLKKRLPHPPPTKISDIVFGLAPRLNAAGRVAHATTALELLIARNQRQAEALAHALEQHNTQRRAIETTLMAEAAHLTTTDPLFPTKSTTFLYREDWCKGVLGIGAARCVEQHYRPTILLTRQGDHATGSARSAGGYDLYESLHTCSKFLTAYGGHRYAAGLTLPLHQLEAFAQAWEAYVSTTITESQRTPTQPVDLATPLTALTPGFYKLLQRLSPFGPHNRQPVFVTDPVIVMRYQVYKDRHLKLWVREPNNPHTWEAIGFGLATHRALIERGSPIAIAYTLLEEERYGQTRLQLRLKDLQPRSAV